MPLEDPTQIDIALKTDTGGVNLVITDAGVTTDPEDRLERLLAKLSAYVGYVMSPDFQADHPGVAVRDVGITVMCRLPPTPQMAGITQVTPRGDAANAIAVEFSVFQGRDGAEADQPAASVSKKPWWKVW